MQASARRLRGALAAPLFASIFALLCVIVCAVLVAPPAACAQALRAALASANATRALEGTLPWEVPTTSGTLDATRPEDALELAFHLVDDQAVTAPADGRVVRIDAADGRVTLLIAHAGAVHSRLSGPLRAVVGVGMNVRRGQTVARADTKAGPDGVLVWSVQFRPEDAATSGESRDSGTQARTLAATPAVALDPVSLVEGAVLTLELDPGVRIDGRLEVLRDDLPIAQLSPARPVVRILTDARAMRLSVTQGLVFRSTAARATVSPSPGDRVHVTLSRIAAERIAGNYEQPADQTVLVDRVSRRASAQSLATFREALARIDAPATAPAPAPAAAPSVPQIAGRTDAAAVARPEDPAPRPADPVVTRTGQRRALVIGNNDYTAIPRLRNARQDARAIGEALAELGFTVDVRTDLDERGMKTALREFRATLARGDEVVFFYAGHGVQIGNANFLLPTDVRDGSEDQVRDESIELQRILDGLSERRVDLALAIIDACRDNPFSRGTRAIAGRGLAPTSAATGQMIAFSAGTGQQALDRLGPGDRDPNSLFTRVLLQEMRVPGVTVDRLIRNVRRKVVDLARTVGHEQVPAIYDQIVGDFYLRR